MAQYHIAQVNVGRIVAPIESETMAGFVTRLDEINALADGTAGFVWRLQSDEGNATSIRVFDDDMMLLNMSVWESIEALQTYTYKTAHAELIKDRKQWFSKMDTPYLALCWVPAGHIPTTGEAKSKLEYLRQHGATPLAFTFTKRFTVEEMLAVQEQL